MVLYLYLLIILFILLLYVSVTKREGMKSGITAYTKETVHSTVRNVRNIIKANVNQTKRFFRSLRKQFGLY